MLSALEVELHTLIKSAIVAALEEYNAPLPRGVPQKDIARLRREPGLMTLAEVAEYLAVSERQVHKLTKEGSLPCTRIGRLVRYQPEVI